MQALILALLLNLSGHIFLHLGDAPLHNEEAGLASPHAPLGSSPAQHQCSLCQDHQLLTLDVPTAGAILVEGQPRVVPAIAASVYDFQLLSLSHSRAPPRN